MILRGWKADGSCAELIGRILTLLLIGRPKLFPVMISSSLVKRGQMTETCLSPELSGTLEPALLLATG